ncbi:MAG: T9SS type A sorting domain-containing protein [Bacteroidota bacterium]
MKKGITLLFLLCSFFLSSQDVDTVFVGGGGSSGLDPYYSPQFLTINVGDTVRWINLQGTHNVDGSVDAFPGNPESFYSGDPSQGWEFDFVFTQTGSYGFECSQGDHSQTQFGIIMVTDIVGLQENTVLDFYLYPNPVQNEVSILHASALDRIEIRDVGQKLLYSILPAQENTSHSINVADLSAGMYFVVIYKERLKGIRRFIKE